jgi:sulfide:quinone oxidoreductase
MKNGTLILGGGFGGLTVATELRRLLGPDHPIAVVDRRDRFYVGLRKLWVLVGEATLEAGERPRDRLAAKRIHFVQADIQRIDAAARTVETDRGRLSGDQLVIALGAESRPDLVPGLHEHGFDLYDPRSVRAAAARVAAIEAGRVCVVIAGLPYKCPPAPYEAVLMLDAHFRARGIRDAIELRFTTLQPGLLPNAGPEGARWIGEVMTSRGIDWAVGREVERFEAGRVVFAGGDALAFDLAIATPPHRPPAVVKASGLTDGGDWIRVDRGTLETGVPGVWAVGDVTHIPLGEQAALPKAGLIAEAEGLRVARAIAARLTGGAEPPPFDGRGECFLELGGGEAALIEGDFYREGGPAVRVVDRSPAHLEAKRRFEAERLERWLGAG